MTVPNRIKEPQASACANSIVPRCVPFLVILTLALPTPASAQWDVFEDPEVQSMCGVVNAAFLEFAVRTCDGALVLITGEDAGFGNTFVTLDGTVEIDGAFAGFVAYDQDADGFFTLWWLSEEGFVIDFDDVTYEPFETNFVPAEFGNVPCEAAEFWQGEGDCDAVLGNMTMQPVEFASDQTNGEDGATSVCGLTSLWLLLLGLGGLALLPRSSRR